MSSINIVRCSIASANVGRVEWQGERKYTKYLKFSLKDRNRIERIRWKAQRPINKHSFLFHGLRITNEPEIIKDAIMQADLSLKIVDPGLSAGVVMIPLDEKQIRRGELSEKLCYALIFKAVCEMSLKVIGLKREEFREDTLESLTTLLDDCAKLNFLGDPGVKKELDELRDLLEKPVGDVKRLLSRKVKDIAKKADEKLPPRLQKLLEERKEKERLIREKKRLMKKTKAKPTRKAG